MATESRIKTRQKYLDKFEDIKVRVPKGKRDTYKVYAESIGTSLNKLIVDLLEAEIKGADNHESRDN